MVMAENDQEASATISKSKSAWKTPAAAVAMNGDDAPPPSPVMIGASPDSWPALSDAAAVAAAAGGAASKPATVASPPPPPLQVSPNSLLLWCYCLLIRKKRGLAMCNG